MTPNRDAPGCAGDPKRSHDDVARELARKDRRISELEEELARLRASTLLAQ